MGLVRDWIDQVRADQPVPQHDGGSVQHPTPALVRRTRRLTVLGGVFVAGAVVRLFGHEPAAVRLVDLATLPAMAFGAVAWIRVEHNWRRQPAGASATTGRCAGGRRRSDG